MGNRAWGIGHGEYRDKEDKRDKENNQCPMPNAQCPMPNSQS